METVSVFVLVLWLNVTTGGIDSATKLGGADSVLHCQQSAAQQLDEKPDEVKKMLAKGLTPRVICIDTSQFGEELRRDAKKPAKRDDV